MAKKNTEISGYVKAIAISFASTCIVVGIVIYAINIKNIFTEEFVQTFHPPVLDKALYDSKLNQLAHITISTSTATTTSMGGTHATSTATSTIVARPAATSTPSHKTTLWPVVAPYPKVGAILPFNRIVAYYGNFYSKAMGVLGEYSPDTVLAMLAVETDKWRLADPTTPVIPALNYIAVTAQGSAGDDGMYRLRMPKDQIQKALDLANRVNGIMFLEVQVGLSTAQQEVPLFDEYLAQKNVHLALDPEFSMKKSGKRPGSVIGTMDAVDINWAIDHLSKIVRDNNLPPKVLLVHRFTENMVTNYKLITPTPEVQVAIVMDGWGTPELKERVYEHVITDEPVQFTGIKLFYKNDLKAPSAGLMPTKQVLDLMPAPSYIQYQ
jgi:hypothetical protein